MTSEDLVHLRIRRPIPLDIASAVTSAVGTLYPDSNIVEASDGDALHIVIERGTLADYQAFISEAEVAEPLEGASADLLQASPTEILMSPATEVGAILVQALRDVMREHEPENYLQFTYEVGAEHMEEGDTRYYMVVARTKEQSPWELHHAAEDRLAAVRDVAQELPDNFRVAVLAAAGHPETETEEQA